MFPFVPLYRNTSIRYLLEITPESFEPLAILSWDEDNGAARDITLALWKYDGLALEFLFYWNEVVRSYSIPIIIRFIVLPTYAVRSNGHPQQSPPKSFF